MDVSPPSASELMIIAASRALRGNRTVFVGVGLPNIACNLARRSHSPDMELVYAVSYTHLDVYKRQKNISPAISNWPNRFSRVVRPSE